MPFKSAQVEKLTFFLKRPISLDEPLCFAPTYCGLGDLLDSVGLSKAIWGKKLARYGKLGLLLFSIEALAQSSGAFISRQDRLQLTDFYTNMLRQKLAGELKLIGVEGQDPVVSLSIEFDDTKVVADADAWRRTQESKAGAERAAQNEAVKSNIAELMEKYKPVQPQLPTPPEAADNADEDGEDAKKEDEIQGGTRLGRLNVDISNATISEIINKAQDDLKNKKTADKADKPQPTAPQVVIPAQPPVTLSISVPAPQSASIEPFVYKAADYIKKITADIILPAKTPKSFADSVPNMVATFLEFKAIANGAPTSGWVKVKVAPPIPEAPKVEAEKPSPKTFIEGIWKPENAFISIVVSVLILGLFMVIAMFAASRALSKGLQNAMSGLGKDIAALRPAEAARDSEEEVAAKDAVAPVVNVTSDQRGSFDQAAAGQAITRDMQNIRRQVSGFISENTFLCAEYMSDMFYDDNGLADFRDLLSFMGYAPLKAAIDHLPRAAVEKLETYIEEHRELPPNMLSGAEIAQRMYAECVSKATLRDESMKVFDPVRAVLIKYDDAVISKFVADADTVSIAILLKTLSVERGNRLMKVIPAAILKESAAMLDRPIESPDQVIAQMITKLSEVSAGIVERSQAQRRLIMRLVKTVTSAEEGLVYDLIPADDWELKRQIMQSKLFLRDVQYVPAKALGQAFSSLPLAKRAEIILVADDALKAALNATVGSGNKRAEMLQAEIEQNQKNTKKMGDISSRKSAILEGLVVAVRRVVGADRQIVDQIIYAQAKALGLKIPEGLVLPADTSRAA